MVYPLTALTYPFLLPTATYGSTMNTLEREPDSKKSSLIFHFCVMHQFFLCIPITELQDILEFGARSPLCCTNI